MVLLLLALMLVASFFNNHCSVDASFVDPSLFALNRGRIRSLQKSSSSTEPTETTTEPSSKSTITVALTREKGKNNKLQDALIAHPSNKLLSDTLDLNIIEINCIEHTIGSEMDEFSKLISSLKSIQVFDYILITSPESAQTFSDALTSQYDISVITNELPKIAVVGKATEKVLSKEGFIVDFVPSKATGQTLAEELPYADKTKLQRVLYPASAKAADTIHDVLTSRKDVSFEVTRFNTYDTIPVAFTDDQSKLIMENVDVACFASPSTVDSWLENIDRFLGTSDKTEEERREVPGSNGDVIAVCIGSTTAKKCLETGRWHANNIYYPKKNPGVDGWADSCFNAAGDVLERQFWGSDW